jgi:TPR repeat protein
MIAKHRIIVICLLLFLIPLSAYAEKLEFLSEAQAAFDIGEYEKAVTLWRTAALNGNSNAQVLMGLAYSNGWGVDRDMHFAEMWYHIAAENNHPSGQFLLGLYYLSSKSDLLDAGIMWLKRSAENGDVSAQGFLQKAEQKRWFENIDRWNLSGQKLASVRQ